MRCLLPLNAVILATNSSKHSGLGLNLIIDSFCIISPIQVDLGFVVIERVIDHPVRQNAGLAPIARVELFSAPAIPCLLILFSLLLFVFWGQPI
jgi:hypothetical protein